MQKKIDNSITSLSSKIREFKKPIRKVGFIVDSELEIDYLDIVRLTENIGLKEKDLKVVSYSKTVFNDTATTEIYTILFVGSVRCV